MSRITESLRSARARGGGFIPFITAGDPDIGTTVEIGEALAGAGADVIELGVPFSDPMADGPTIQRSSARALSRGVRVSDVLGIAAELRRKTDAGILLFSYLNPLMRYGIDRLSADAASAGVDGVLVTDAAGFEASEVRSVLNSKGIEMISLAAPTTSDERLQEIARTAQGFVYAVSRAGVTGTQEQMATEAEALTERIRRVSSLPIAVGFGISTARQVAEVHRFADAAVVGSAIVNVIERSPPGEAAGSVGSFVRGLLPAVAKTGIEI